MNVIRSIIALFICTALFSCTDIRESNSNTGPISLEFRIIKKGAEISIENTENEVLINNHDVKSAQVAKDSIRDEYNILLEMTDEGTVKLYDLSGKYIGQHLAIIIDGHLISSPRVMEQISGGSAMLSGGFTEAEANRIALGVTKK